MRILSTGEVGIGGAPSLTYDLDVKGPTGATNGTAIRILNSGTAASDDVALYLRNSATGTTNTTAGIYFGDGDASSSGFIEYTHTNDRMTFRVNGATAYYVNSAGSLLVVGATGALGFGTGAGGTATQGTSRTTGVTVSKSCGSITLFSTTTTAGQTTTFTVTNTLVAATDTIVVSQQTGSGIYFFSTKAAAGSFNISVYTPAAVGTAEAPIINFAVIKAVAA
jgi:hypothetical protein